MFAIAFGAMLAMLQVGAADAVPQQVAPAARTTVDDKAAIGIYVDSLSKAALYGHCKNADRSMKAEYDATLKAWFARNQAAIARGREALREEGLRTGADKVTMARDDATWMASEFARFAQYKKLARCDAMRTRDNAQ